MKKLLAPILAACLMVGGETALAENWIPFQDSDTTLVDTDSYVDSCLRSSLSIKSKAKGSSSTIKQFSSIRFNFRSLIERQICFPPVLSANHIFRDTINPVVFLNFPVRSPIRSGRFLSWENNCFQCNSRFPNFPTN